MHHWTEDEDAMLRELYLSGQRRSAIADRMAKTEQSVKARLYMLPFTAEEKAQRCALRRKWKNNPMFGTTRAWKDQPRKHFPPPTSALDDRDRRLATAPRDLTAALMGDPRPGYSALERRT